MLENHPLSAVCN